jgi:ABC-2 type transport system permease protein
MTDRKRVEDRGPGSRGSAAPTWWLVFSREFSDLWIGGKGLTLVLFYSLLLGAWSYVLASNTELRLIAPKEMVWEMLEATIAVACFIALIAGADSISGDRERATLEGLLLTPTSRRQIVLGKYLPVVSLWPAVLTITVPYLYVLAQGDEIFGRAVLLGALMGSILAPAMAALGMFVSVWSNTIKISMIVSLGIYLLILMPTSLPGHVQSGPIGLAFQQLSPMMATFHFMAKILVNHRALAEVWTALLSPVLCAVVLHGLLFAIAAPRLRLDPAEALRWRPSRIRVFGALAVVWLLAAPAGSPARAQESRRAALQISVDMQHKVVNAGDSILYRTAVRNIDAEPSRPLTVAMNIINLDAKGDIVDPEDWSPQRTQYVDQLAPGESVDLSWRVNAILGGDYMVYMVAIPKPDGPEATSVPAASPGIHLTIRPFAKINPRGVLLYVLGTPLLLLLGMALLFWYRRRSVDRGQEPAAGATKSS